MIFTRGRVTRTLQSKRWKRPSSTKEIPSLSARITISVSSVASARLEIRSAANFRPRYDYCHRCASFARLVIDVHRSFCSSLPFRQPRAHRPPPLVNVHILRLPRRLSGVEANVFSFISFCSFYGESRRNSIFSLTAVTSIPSRYAVLGA